MSIPYSPPSDYKPILPTASASLPSPLDSTPRTPDTLVPHVLPATPFRLITTTIVLLGLQLAWAVELAYGTPYLLSLGMDKSLTSLVWLAGPISGLLVHPIIGAMSDNCSLRMGRRRPFILFGTVGSLASMALVALSRPLGGSAVEDATDTGTHVRATQATIWLAVIGFYVLDFCINTVQAASRALIVDVMAPEDQAVANGIAGIMICLGNVVGYAAGLVDWPSAVGIPGTPAAQFQLVCSVACMIFAACTACTVVFTREVPGHPTAKLSLVASVTLPFVNVRNALPNLPPVAVRVCTIQLVAWLGWFPFLFYATTYVAQFTSNSHHPFDGPEAAHATRQGSLAFFAFSIVSLVIAIVLPWATKRWFISLAVVWMVGESSFAAVMLLGTFMVHSGRSAATVVALCGMAWAIGTWVPMALLGQALAAGSQPSSRYTPVNRHMDDEEASDDDGRACLSNRGTRARSMSPYLQRRRDLSSASLMLQASSSMVSIETLKLDSVGSSKVVPLRVPSGRRPGRQENSQIAPSAGVVLGLHNVSVVVPQLVVSMLAAVMFAVLPDGHDLPMVPGASEDSIGWLFRVGGLAAAFAVLLIGHLLLRHRI